MEPVVPRFRPAHPSEDRSGILQEITTQSLSKLSSNPNSSNHCFSREFLFWSPNQWDFCCWKNINPSNPPTPKRKEWHLKSKYFTWERHLPTKTILTFCKWNQPCPLPTGDFHHQSMWRHQATHGEDHFWSTILPAFFGSNSLKITAKASENRRSHKEIRWQREMPPAVKRGEWPGVRVVNIFVRKKYVLWWVMGQIDTHRMIEDGF